MKKILFVMQSLYNGGSERSLVNLLNELPEEKYSIDLLLFKQEGIFLNQVPNNVKILETPTDLEGLFAPVNKLSKYTWVKLCGTVKSHIAEKKKPEQAAYRWENYYSKHISELKQEYDVAIAYISGEVMYYVAEKVHASRKVVWIHNDYRTAGHPKKYDIKYLKQMDAIVSISNQCVKILAEEFPAMQEKIYCIPNLTSSAVVKKRADEFEPEEYKNCQYNILSIGRLNEQKGFDIAVKAASCLKRKGVKFKWFVIGTGDLETSLKDLTRKEKVEDVFELIGARENPYPYIKNCTIFVQSSRWEGKSVVIDEAKILAKPIVATNYPTVEDQIANGKEGIIVDMSPEGISEGIMTLLNNSVERLKLTDYLTNNEYGNQQEVNKYIELIDNSNLRIWR